MIEKADHEHLLLSKKCLLNCHPSVLFVFVHMVWRNREVELVIWLLGLSFFWVGFRVQN